MMERKGNKKSTTGEVANGKTMGSLKEKAGETLESFHLEVSQ